MTKKPTHVHTLRTFRTTFFSYIAPSRFRRILGIAFFIAIIWCMADAISGNLSFNLTHDLVTFLIAVIIERCLPWGKPPYP